jgi:branched-chain amino acid transport system permease protein
MAVVRTRTQWALLIGFLILIFLVPLFASSRVLNFLIVTGITIIAVHGLNILTGYCGQLSLGQSAFVAVGAYTGGILASRLGIPFWLELPAAGLMAGIVGLFFGLPSLRVKGVYLVIATIAAQVIIMWLSLQLVGLTGGQDGLKVSPASLGGIVFKSRQSVYILVMVMAVLATLVAKNLVRGRLGRAFVAVRDNDLAAEVMGVNLYVHKLLAFFVGCFFAGIAGSLWAHYIGMVHPEMFTIDDSIWMLGMIIVGGMGSTTGVIFGTFFLRFLDEMVTIVGPLIGMAIPAFSGQTAASLGLLAHGLVIILFLIFEPRGLYHRWIIFRSYYRLWPFSY